ncbi:DHH family phosphoesterase [Candidatus Micrarchaeota archaeon]|nr:DHH family phosphoesterase [Candidatus Micrarchaeota archaeon]
MDFYSRCEEAKEIIKQFKEPLVIGHYDCDGITATAVASYGLKKLGKNHSTLTIRKVSDRELAKIGNSKELIFVDLGASSTELIDKLDAQIVILDHHQTAAKKSNVFEVNPHMFGIDGGVEICSAGVTYSVFQDLETIHLAIVGAIGDMQAPMRGLNSKILEKAVKEKIIKCDRDLSLFGRVSRPLTWFLTYSLDPYIPGLTANEENCTKFLEDLGIRLKENEKWLTYYDLTMAEREKLVTGLVKHLYSKGLGKTSSGLFGEVYTLLNQPKGTELSDGNEFSTLINACGRNSRADIGIGVCLDNKDAYEQAKTLLALHRKSLREGISYGLTHTEDLGRFYFLDGRNIIPDGIIGIIAGMLYSTKARNKPIIAIAYDELGEIKVSGRATKELVELGVNLGKLMKNSSSDFGFGGGHKAAAGATIPKDRLNDFLLNASRELENTVSN